MGKAALHTGDVLTLARFLGTPLFAWSFLAAVGGASTGWLAAATFAGVCLSDVFDGRLARRVGKASSRGAALDAGADVFFILVALGSGWSAGLVPWWVPTAIATSFAYYVVDSSVRTRQQPHGVLVASRIGHWGGICNYALVGVLTFNTACGLHLLGPRVLSLLFVVVPLYSAAAILTRLPLRGGRDRARSDPSGGQRAA